MDKLARVRFNRRRETLDMIHTNQPRNAAQVIAADISDALSENPDAFSTLLACDIAIAYSVGKPVASRALRILSDRGIIARHALGIAGDTLWRVCAPAPSTRVRIPVLFLAPARPLN
jgi:hypothetical protein